eukprot:39520-Prymnesium_polylepis.1
MRHDCSSLAPPPRLLHQSWANASAPLILEGQAVRWRAVLGPRWRHRLWTDADNRALWAKHAPSMLPVYDRYAQPIERADATRLLYLAVEGGVYADLDIAPCEGTRRVLERLLQRQPLLLVRDPVRGPEARKQIQHVSNFFMASTRGHPFWWFAIKGLASRQRHRWGTMYSTGPYFVDAMWKHFSKHQPHCKATVLTHDEWQRLQVGAHHWLSTWHASANASGLPAGADVRHQAM